MQDESVKRSVRAEYLENHLQNMTVAQLLLEYLKLEGVDRIFGIPGGAVIFIADQLKQQRDRFDFIICRHETGAAYMADGYYRVTGKLGVVLTTAGPSAVNALTGSMNAEAGNSAVLTITGEVPEQYFGQGYLQEGVDAHLDVNAVFKNAVQSSALIPSASSFRTLIEQALRNAMARPRRAAHISIPNNVAGTCVMQPPAAGGIPFPAAPENYRTEARGADPAQMEQAFEALVHAKKPLIFLGNGARMALRDATRLHALQDFSERFAIPVMTTPDGKGIFPESHPMSLRNYGMTPCAWPALYMKTASDADHFDALCVIGSSLGELATSPAATNHYDKDLIPSHHCIQIDLDQAVIGRSFPITLGVVGDAGAAIDQLLAQGEGASPSPDAETRRQMIASLKQSSPFEFPEDRAGDATPLHPAAAMRIVNELVQDGHIFIDAGNCVGWSLNNLVIDPPNQFHIALGMGPMGFAVGAVVGGKSGAPAKDCVAIVGDGAFMMHGSEISTAAQNKIGAVWIVLNDNDLAMVSQGMAVLFPPEADWDDYYALGKPDLVKYSEGLGACAVEVTCDQGPDDMKRELASALERARATGQPQVLVLHIDPKPMPKYGWPHPLVQADCS
ncbi:thiamine pyrophosphate-binding protein [Sulfitobacter sp. S190]|uniref:thiamine pyrophosphate-binding protein n=1 Tax=Sulfitobacter sp. S190 TaxID=2867022 RepID=UPI0021A75186|nr:thiamine pyrophosphate-binding protein [Sulfitobacter sp. S190]UWR23904.1 thiamine pyrophosphate-binding protein [Sulfitobacter sp. S190]